MFGCCGGGSQGLEHLFSHDGILASDGYTEKSHVRHVRDTVSASSKETRRFESSRRGAVRTLGVAVSHISSPGVSTCPAESVDEEACCAGTTSRVSI